MCIRDRHHRGGTRKSRNGSRLRSPRNSMRHNQQPSMEKLSTLQSLVRALPKRGDKPAIFMLRKQGADVWTYDKLNNQIVRLAAGLAAIGVCRGTHVALLAGTGPEWIVACLAIIAAGGVAVPLDAQLAEDVRVHVLKDSAARFIFTTRDQWTEMQASFS